jgi:glucose/arabinose dehydrogenase
MRHRRLITALAAASLVVAAASSVAQPRLETRDVITGLDTPWEILWGPDGWLWMTERGGRISRVDPASGEQRVLVTIPDVLEQTESGLLGMALHPSFADSPYVFVVYNYSAGGGIAEKLVRYRYTGQVLVEPTVLLENIPGYPTHDGSRLLVTPDHRLLMSTGDAQNQPGAQSQTQIVGKILRLELDGSAPADNPWASAPHPTNLLWTTGHRNAQGLTYSPSGILYSSEHGPNNDDEVNLIMRGRNYGWPTVQGYCNTSAEIAFCADSNVVEPLRAWTPTLANAGIEYYASAAIPEWQNSLLMTTLKESDLRQLKLSADGRSIVSESIFFDNVYGRLRDIAIAPDGRVFLATSNRDGRARNGFPLAADDRIIEIRPVVAQAATITAPIVSPTSVRPGEQITITFSAIGPFTANNVFTAQLSDAGGAFATPRELGTLEGLNGGTITTTLACDVAAGAAYRVRIVSSSPVATSPVNDTAITVAALASPVITRVGDTLVATRGYLSYVWRDASGTTVSTTGRLVPRQNGSYVVYAVDSNGCEVVSPVFVVSDIGGVVDESRNHALRASPSPVPDRIDIERALGRPGAVRIELVDLRGDVVRGIVAEPRSGSVRASLDVGDLPAAAYVLRVTCGAEQWIRRVVRQ